MHMLVRPVLRRRIWYVRADDEAEINALVWRRLWFNGQSVSYLREALAAALGEANAENITLCQARLTPPCHRPARQRVVRGDRCLHHWIRRTTLDPPFGLQHHALANQPLLAPLSSQWKYLQIATAAQNPVTWTSAYPVVQCQQDSGEGKHKLMPEHWYLFAVNPFMMAWPHT
ncbi:unnamed protein product [Urochloa humidicola]